MKGFIEGHFLTGIAEKLVRFPQLNELKFEKPLVTGNEATLGEEIVALQYYAEHVGNLASVLIGLKEKWGSEFNLQFLINSPRTHQFSAEQLHEIVAGIQKLDLNYIPTLLLASVFSLQPLKTGLQATELTLMIKKILLATEFNIAQKTQILAVVTGSFNFHFVESLLQAVKNTPIALQPMISTVFLNHMFHKADDTTVFSLTQTLLDLFKTTDDPVLSILLKKLAAYPIHYHTTLAMVEKVNDLSLRHAFLKIFVYSCLNSDYEVGKFDENFLPILAGLVAWSNTKKDDFNLLLTLFDSKPFPKFSILKQCFALNELDVKHFLLSYELDPPGLMYDANILTAYNINNVEKQIDAIVDLGRQTGRLFYNQREQLLKRFIYVNCVGHSHNLQVPGMPNATEYQKPVKDLTKAQVKQLIAHYKLILGGELQVRNQQMLVAELEFAALIRHAMYRCLSTATIKLPYSTQLLILLSVMMQDNSAFLEIRTGEGKGITTALIATYKLMKQGAVDICSSNMELARRDLEEFQDYYDYLDIKTALIVAQSPYQTYQQNGINYSDVSELALFQVQRQFMHERMPTRVCGMLDEADFIVLDNAAQFRFAKTLDTQLDPHQNPHEWVYPWILQFVSRPIFINDKCSAEQDILNLREFIINRDEIMKLNRALFLDFPKDLLDRWIDSAYIAFRLRKGEDFVIRDNIINLNGKELAVLEAWVKINFRENSNSKFSDGVHQFLHARLNTEIQTKSLRFLIEPEKTYLASKSSKNFLDYYLRSYDGVSPRGEITGLTGTIGSIAERQEVQSNYGIQFIKFPPHLPLLRKDLPPLLARRKRKLRLMFGKNDSMEAHFHAIMKNAHAEILKKRPVLIICNGVKSSQQLYDYFLTNWLEPTVESIQLFNGEQRELREADIVRRAGHDGIVTITTPMLARGTDIKPDNKKYGPHIIMTYIADTREHGQGIGRGGRNGAPGTSILIVSEQEFSSRHLALPLPAELESEVEKIRLQITEDKTQDRFERQWFADIKDQFFHQYILLCHEAKINMTQAFQAIRSGAYKSLWDDIELYSHQYWDIFLRKIDKEWRELVNQMRNDKLINPTISYTQHVESKIKALTIYGNDLWGSTYAHIVNNMNLQFNRQYQQVIIDNKVEVKADEGYVLHLPPKKAVNFFLPGILKRYKSPDFSLNDKALDSSDINIEAIMIEMNHEKVSPKEERQIVRWNDFSHYVQERLVQYGQQWFKSAKREEAFALFRQAFEKINSNPVLLPTDKLTQLINIIGGEFAAINQELEFKNKAPILSFTLLRAFALGKMVGTKNSRFKELLTKIYSRSQYELKCNIDESVDNREQINQIVGNLNVALQDLVQHNYLVQYGVDIDSHPDVQPTMNIYKINNAETRRLVISTMHEIERFIRLSFTDIKKFGFFVLWYGEAEAKFGCTVFCRLIDSTEISFSIGVDNLKLHSTTVHCDWKENKLHSNSTNKESTVVSSLKVSAVDNNTVDALAAKYNLSVAALRKLHLHAVSGGSVSKDDVGVGKVVVLPSGRRKSI
jgi:hypothetical protein